VAGKAICARQLSSHLEISPEDIWVSNDDLRWFEGYDNKQMAIIDDFRAKHVSFSFLLRLLDRYPLRIPVKGDYVNWAPRVIVITCPYSPDQCFSTRQTYLPEDLEQLHRRITKIVHFDHELSTAQRIAVCTSCVFYPSMPSPVSPNLSLNPPRFYDLTNSDEMEEDAHGEAAKEPSKDSTSDTEVMTQVEEDEESLETYSSRMGLKKLYDYCREEFREPEVEDKATLEDDGYELLEAPKHPVVDTEAEKDAKKRYLARHGFFEKPAAKKELCKKLFK